jgi:hypothetical protein
MAAGLGFKDFQAGSILTAADVNGYLMQGILVFSSTAARDAAITSPQEGQFAYTTDNNTTYYYTGSAWAVAEIDQTAYTAYTPTAVASNWTIGNGTFTTYWKSIGKLVHFYGRFEFGSTSSVSASGTFAITLPTNARNSVEPEVYQIAQFRDTSAGLNVGGYSRIQNATQMFCYWYDPEPTPLAVYGSPWNTGVVLPFTYTTGDFVAWNMIYERA